MSLQLPLDYVAIERILPHRYPFLLVDRVTELEPDRRILGIKNVSQNDRYLSHGVGERPTLPPTILTEAIAQVGAILILAKPENREKLPLFMGIERVRYREPQRDAIVQVVGEHPQERFHAFPVVAEGGPPAGWNHPLLPQPPAAAGVEQEGEQRSFVIREVDAKIRQVLAQVAVGLGQCAPHRLTHGGRLVVQQA